MYCGNGRCCPSRYPYYCAATNDCFDSPNGAVAWCDGQCVACRISPQGSCSDPAYPLTCDEICCSIEYPFYCAATRLCYGTEAGAAAACGAACVACTSATAIDGRDALLGPWTAEGTTDFNFGGAIFVPSRTESGQVTILAGTQADRIVYPWGACGVPGVMTGRDAAVVAGHACTVASGGESWAYTFTSGEFVLSTSSLLLFNAVGDVTYTDTRRVAYPGQFMIQVMLTR